MPPGRSSHPAKQDRSRDSLERMLDSAEAQIRLQGLSGVDLRAVCANAGCTTGALYGRFAGKDELLDALFDRFEGQVRDVAARYRDSIATGTSVRKAAALDDFLTMLDLVYSSSGALVAALIEGSYQRPALGRRAVTLMEDAASLLHLALDRQGEPTTKSNVVAATQVAFAAFDQQLFFDRIGIARDRTEFVAALKQAMLGLLRQGHSR